MELTGLVAWLSIGGLVGWSVGTVIPNRPGLLRDLLVGFVGGFLGGFLFHEISEAGAVSFGLESLFAAFLGAIMLLYATHLVAKRSSLQA